jgi:hypothetical protein
MMQNILILSEERTWTERVEKRSDTKNNFTSGRKSDIKIEKVHVRSKIIYVRIIRWRGLIGEWNVALFCEVRYLCTRSVPKVSVLSFLCTTWESSTSLMYNGELVMTLAACTYLFKLNRLSLSWAIAVCVRSCFITSVTFAMQPWYCSRKILTSRTDA